MSLREIVATAINQDLVLRALGLADGSVYQADTLDSPTEFPFVVVRWLEDSSSSGPVVKRPAELWIYDKQGDYSRASKIGDAALDLLRNITPVEDEETRILMIETEARQGQGRGRDMFDSGYSAIVIPYRFTAIAAGP